MIKIGVVNVTSGPAQNLGKGVRKGIEAYFKVNGNQIHGRKISLILKDDGYEPKLTRKHTSALKDEEKVFALFSYVGTPTSKQAVPIARNANIPFVSPFTGAEFLRNSKANPHVVNLRASYYDETKALVDLFVDQNKKKIAVFNNLTATELLEKKG
ncbi:MAG: ABC transporter substrate-binding protein [Oligoflexales bacterium]|nr:ABC transporter substrate-binding protein [Oligoflexales bacterium]